MALLSQLEPQLYCTIESKRKGCYIGNRMYVGAIEDLYYEVMFEYSLKVPRALRRVLFKRIFKDHE